MENSHAGVVTTITSDVIKLCAGGKIWIQIPDWDNGIPCCPTGDAQGTFITAVLFFFFFFFVYNNFAF